MNSEKLKKNFIQLKLERLQEKNLNFLDSVTEKFNLSFQNIKFISEFMIDLESWQENSLEKYFSNIESIEKKGDFLKKIEKYKNELTKNPKKYTVLNSKPKNSKKPLKVVETDKKIHGMCPVASEKTVCCNLRTIDAVENCAFGCSYCSIQTFYNKEYRFDKDFGKKLAQIEIDPNRKYHFGTGQSSDSLVWGNSHGILDDLVKFAEKNPNIMLEFKTKSKNIKHLLQKNLPKNIFCSWSLNTEVIIKNEEHFTASLDDRLNSARKIADKGQKVAFHFHPIVIYENYQKDYLELINKVKSMFRPEEILFISFGSVTFIKPVIKKIRGLKYSSKILQMPFATDPHGKYTYPDKLKVEKFRFMFDAFREYQEDVFFYLCMEKADIWDKVFGFHYETNEIFEEKMLDFCFTKFLK
jgi:spore photoproduct lyase